jgi:uncharacterized protein (TIGR00375 family)
MSLLFADLHIHSKYSRATSSNMDLKGISQGSKIKGLNLIGTGDFSHPLWFKELKNNLSETNFEGLYEYENIFYILSNEISLIYTQDGKGRRVHNIILAPNFEVAEQINDYLGKKGRLNYDGRPIFGFTCPELVENMMSISKDIMIIPAHIFTPWFSIFGSMSGFDSVEECFADKVKHIHALETGLSSDPAMNWRLSKLDKYTLVSFSDSHSPYPWRLGRECCVFDIEKPEYSKITNAIIKKNKNEFLYTIEFFPEEGKYHFDGHRNCNFSCSPEESIKMKNICPVCHKQLTIGVAHRVEELADRPNGFRPKDAIPFKSLVPLSELIAAVLGYQAFSKKVQEMHNLLIDRFGSEFNVMLNIEKRDLEKVVSEKIADIIIRNRLGKIKVKPGFDGVYGTLILEKDDEKQQGLGKFVK